MKTLFSVGASIEENIRLMKEIKQNIDRLTKTYNSIRSKIISNVGPNQIIEDKIGNTIATISTQTRTSFNSKDFLVDHPKLHEKYSSQTEFSVLRLK